MGVRSSGDVYPRLLVLPDSRLSFSTISGTKRSFEPMRSERILTQRRAQRSVTEWTCRCKAMEAMRPPEVLPHIGTVGDPSLFFDDGDLILAYEIAPISGDGCAVIRFSDVIHCECNPLNTHGIALGQQSYPTEFWSFTEVTGSERTEKWAVLKPRFWTISFNDRTVEVVFNSVDLVASYPSVSKPGQALLKYLSSSKL